MREAAALVRMLSIVEALVESGKLSREEVDACYQRCKSQNLGTLETADQLALLVIPPDTANDDTPGANAA